MKKGNLFFVSSLAILLLIRGIILLLTILGIENHLMFMGHIVHHFWFGFAFILIALLISRKYAKSKIVLAGIGFGILADELVFMLFGGIGYADYWKPASIIGAVVCLAIIYLFRNKIGKLFD